MVVPLNMDWRHVLFANWAVDPSIVDAHLPSGLTLDTYDGAGWLSVVPFTNRDVRPTLLPPGTGIALPELNLRTYVLREDTPGVYFFSLDAAGILAVVGARIFHHLPYYYASIDLEGDDRVRFSSRRRHPGARPVRVSATYEATGNRIQYGSASLEHFLVARHQYFTQAGNGSLRYARIDHDPWPLFEAEATIDADDLFAANGFDGPDSDPTYLYSPGVDTVASRSRRVR